MELRNLGDLDFSNDPRAAKADITNAPELFGDPYGDIEDGDFEEGDLYGDADDFGDFEDGDVYGDSFGDTFGDVLNDGTLGTFKQISGDVYGDLYGDTASRRAKIKATARKYRNPALITAGAVGSALIARRVAKKIAAARARKTTVRKQLAAQRSKQTLRNQAMVRKNAGKIARNKKMPFFQIIGARLNSSPIDPLEGFVADMFKYNLDRQASDTPFYQESAIAVFALGTWTATATGTAANRFYTALILQLGINYLNAAPGTIFTVTGTFPTINGTLTVSAQPWIFTIEKGYDVRFMFFPWQLVSNRPLPVLGAYSNANPIIVQVTGLPAASSVNLVVPGSLHPWTVAMRNALI